MKYAADSYLKAKMKWGRINQMRDEIDNIIRERARTESSINSLFGELTRGMASKKITLDGVLYEEKSTLLLTPNGFGYIPSWRTRSYTCKANKKLYETIAKNKERVLAAIPRGRGDKKEILTTFLRVWEKHKYEFQPIRIEHRTNKTVTWIKHSYSGETETERLKASSVLMEIGDDRTRIAFVLERPPDRDDHTKTLDQNDFTDNMLKEQLYLPLWKLLVKAKRRALKEKKRIEKIDQELRKELAPFLVAREL